MRQGFFEDLTDPRIPLLPVAGDENEQEMLTEYGSALQLLRTAAPENGINLVPRWEQFLAGELEKQTNQPDRLLSAATQSQHEFPSIFKSWTGPLFRYAAVLLVGAALGLATAGNKTTNELPALDLTRECEYTHAQGTAMFALLESLKSNGPLSSVQLASADLASCMGCHDAALGMHKRTMNIP